MSKSTNQKLKLWYVLKILQEHTDDKHGITMAEIISYLEDEDIYAERKSIGSDIKALKDAGVDIGNWKEGKEHKYFLLSREFELAEIKLLVDAVLVSKFISREQTKQIVKKLEGLVSKHQAKELNRQVYIANRPKTDSEVVIRNIDYIYGAMTDNKMISFEYYDWNPSTLTLEKRDNGDKTNISPWMLIWDDENYYMVAYDKESDMVKHYRVDKMKRVSILEGDRLGADMLDGVDMADYSNGMFNMFSGEEESVKLEVSPNVMNVFVDRFGRDNILVVGKKDDKILIRLNVSVSVVFFGWLVVLGKDVRIVGPENVVEEFEKYLEEILNNQRQQD